MRLVPKQISFLIQPLYKKSIPELKNPAQPHGLFRTWYINQFSLKKREKNSSDFSQFEFIQDPIISVKNPFIYFLNFL
jgi:hypothetical protein